MIGRLGPVLLAFVAATALADAGAQPTTAAPLTTTAPTTTAAPSPAATHLSAAPAPVPSVPRAPCYENKTLVLKVRGFRRNFCELPSGAAFEAGCFPEKKCFAYLSLRLAATKELEVGPGGQSPAALLCHSIDGMTIKAEDMRGNQMCVCRFGDRSMATCDSFILDAPSAAPTQPHQ